MDYTANIRAAADAATTADYAAGLRWYPAAGAIAATIADRTGFGTDRIAAAIAALSPRNPWAWNVQDAAALATFVRDGGTMPRVTTFNTNRDRAIAMLRGERDWASAALKVRSFVANICGDVDRVTVDVWAVRVATAGAESEVGGVRKYRAIEDAYRTVAAERGMTPRELQAVTWVWAERIGLGSNRRGRHTATLKAGTFEWVAAALAAA